MIETHCRARDLKPGDLADLRGDPYADPDAPYGLNSTLFECELQAVREVIWKAPQCVAIGFDFDLVGYPPAHWLTIHTEDEG